MGDGEAILNAVAFSIAVQNVASCSMRGRPRPLITPTCVGLIIGEGTACEVAYR